MTKGDLITVAADAANTTKKDATIMLDAVLDAVAQSLSKGESVTLTGFGTFRVSKRASRTGVNPRDTKMKIKIPEMILPAFKAGKSLKDAIRK